MEFILRAREGIFNRGGTVNGKKARAIRKMYGVKHVRLARQIEKGAVDLSALKDMGRERKRQRRSSKPVIER